LHLKPGIYFRQAAASPTADACYPSFTMRSAKAMRNSTNVPGFILAALGMLLVYAAATGKVASLLGAEEGKTVPARDGPQVSGVLGSPSATTTIPGNQLPPSDPKFGGVIKENAAQSKAWWAPRIVPPKGAPNVLPILTDDVGFGAPGASSD
jgi:hypothetical protein